VLIFIAYNVCNLFLDHTNRFKAGTRMKKQFSQLVFLIFLLTISAAIFCEENRTPEQELAAALVASKSEDDRSKLLQSHKSAVTVELRKALIVEANQLRVKNDFANAITIYELAKNVAEQIGDRAGVGYALHGIGTVHNFQSDRVKGLDHFQQGLAIAQEVQDKALEARCLRSIGSVQFDEGSPDLALESCKKSLESAEQAQDKREIGNALFCLGSFNTHLGNYAIALEYLEKSLVIQKEIDNKALAASILNGMGIVYDRQGNFELALEHYGKSLQLWEEVGDPMNIANILNNMGDPRLLKSDDKALEYNKKSLSIAEEVGAKQLAVRACINIGNRYRDKGEYDQSLTFSSKGLAIAEAINYGTGIAGSHRVAAAAYYLKGDYEKSLQSANNSVSAAKKIGNRQSIWKALEAQGKAYRSLKQPDLARKSFDEAIATIEDWRAHIAGGEMEGHGHFAERISPYQEMIQLLITEKDPAEAFAYAERAKARVLLDVIRAGKINIAERMTSEEKQQEQKLHKELSVLNRKIQAERMNSESDEKHLADLETKIQRARLDFESFQTKLYVAHPELRVHRGESDPLKAKEAIELFTDSKTVLLEYVVTEEKTFLFILESGKQVPNVFTIPIAQETLAERVGNFRIQMGNRDLSFLTTSAELFKLLVAPAAKHMKDAVKVVLVPDDVLWSLPFQALRTPKQRFLIEECAISYVPSFTVLRESRRLHKKQKSGTPETLLALGNPTLGNQTIEKVKRAYRDQQLEPLPDAEKEVNALKQLYGINQSKVYVGPEAREYVLKNEASKFDVVHLATHGIVNDVTPMYSQLILAQGSDAEDDGILEAWEIMNLRLNAELVVLSACDTALGKIQKGEGMIGLAWSLFVAGSPTTVASQWKVDSASTTELMLGFHRNLKSNISKAEALRQASLKLLRSDHYHHPFFWAPYVLIGDSF
jgi:CHAT domain-containing protein